MAAGQQKPGRLYFLLLLFAPLVVYPLAWRAGASLPLRLALSLLPGLLWWLTEIPVRLRWNTLPEALWLAAEEALEAARAAS